jgi:hypothetical protein
MPLAQNLADFKASVVQCDSLIANAHKTDAAGVSLFPALDQQQITVAAFLNLFKGWETFLESSLAELMIGTHTVSGSKPIKYVAPSTINAAKALVIHVLRFFDYGNHENVRKVVNMYFQAGYPYEPHFSAAIDYLKDLRTMRNAAAHITSTTQVGLEALALRLLGMPSIGIDLYTLLMTNDPTSAGDTIYATYRDKLLITADLIAQG